MTVGVSTPNRFEERTLGARLALLFSVFLIPVFAVAQIRQDVTLSVLGNFPFQSSGGNVTIDGTNSAGGAASYRLYFKTHSAIELGYGFTRGTFYYLEDESSVHGGIISLNQGSTMHELTAAYLYHFWPDRRLQPFAEVGGGSVIFKPTGGSTSNTLFGAVTQARGAYLYGGGLDYHVTGPFALRLEYRMLNFKAPDFFGAGLTTHSWMRTSSPQIGVAYKF
jgi:opacity protein-like surface antigen